MRRISIPAPARGATWRLTVGTDGALFQFPPLREGRPRRRLASGSWSYFNSRPCERGDQTQHTVALECDISIPAPARGATISGDMLGDLPEDFNSRPCERGDTEIFEGPRDRGYFNSRPCERGDHCDHQQKRQGNISIPAPARGATHARALCWKHRQHFNSRPCERGDSPVWYGIIVSRSISIPAPARGATSNRGKDEILVVISIPAPARGATVAKSNVFGVIFISIPAPARGATSEARQALPTL